MPPSLEQEASSNKPLVTSYRLSFHESYTFMGIGFVARSSHFIHLQPTKLNAFEIWGIREEGLPEYQNFHTDISLLL